MISLPIVFREFAAAARRKRTYVQRGMFVGLLAGVLFLFVVNQPRLFGSQVSGLFLLKAFAWVIFVIVGLIGPSLTSGCITDEKEQGTLGLLLLTQLRSADIVLGKFMSRGVDLLLLVLSATPFLFVPILLGGVSWQLAAGVTLSILSLLLLTLSIGMMCSTIARTSMQAQLAAYILSFALTILPPLLAGQSVHVLSSLDSGFLIYFPDWLRLASPMNGLLRPVIGPSSMHDTVLTFLGCGMLTVTLLTLCAWILPHTLREKMPQRSRPMVATQRPPSLTRIFAPQKRSTRRASRRNPLVWLDFSRQRHWVLQAITALGLGIWIAWAFISDARGQQMDDDIFYMLYFSGAVFAYAMIFLVILYAARSFASGREDGSLELLLTTPLSNRTIVRGKVLSALGHHAPFFVAACGLLVAGAIGIDERHLSFQLCRQTGGFVCSLCLGLLFSARSKSAMQATTRTILSVLFVMLVSYVAGEIGGEIIVDAMMALYVDGSFMSPRKYIDISVVSSIIQLTLQSGVAWTAYRILIRDLREYAAK